MMRRPLQDGAHPILSSPPIALLRARRLPGRLALLICSILFFSPAALPAQDTSAPASGFDDPAQDIFIEGIGFSKLILEMVPNPELESARVYTAFMPLLERDLCWSGLFNMTGGRTRHCALRDSSPRIDMRLSIRAGEKQLRVRLQDSGPEGLMLFEETVVAGGIVSEARVMELVNGLALRITGQPGLLGSTIAYVMRQPGFAKVIVATNTHGRKPKRISTNDDINLLPHWAPGGESLVYTILDRNGTGVFYHNLVRPQPNGERSRFLTGKRGLSSGGAFSHDGSRVAFTMSRGGIADLYEKNLRTGKVRQFTFRDGIETSADWAPDTKQLVFVSDRSGGLNCPATITSPHGRQRHFPILEGPSLVVQTPQLPEWMEVASADDGCPGEETDGGDEQARGSGPGRASRRHGPQDGPQVPGRGPVSLPDARAPVVADAA